MGLDYLKKETRNSSEVTTAAQRRKKTRVNRISKPKFFTLLTANLLLWLFVSGACPDITLSSIGQSFRTCLKKRNLAVTGVICDSKTQSAIIADEIYNVGDTVRGFTITAIDQNGVEFKKDGKMIYKEVTSLR